MWQPKWCDAAWSRIHVSDCQEREFGFRLIKAMEPAPGALFLKEIEAAAGVPPSRTHAYPARLRAVGLAAQDQEGGLRPQPARPLARPRRPGRLKVCIAAFRATRHFRDETDKAVHLPVWAGQAPVFVPRLDGWRGGSLYIRIGTMLRLERSTSGLGRIAQLRVSCVTSQ